MIKILQQLFKTDSIILKKKNHLYDLIIYDDIYPHPSSGFRVEEFTNLLKAITNSKAVLSGAAYVSFKIPLHEHKKHIAGIIKINPELNNKLEYLDGTVNINCKLFYCIFLNNIHKNLWFIEKFKLPFVFTLYPGGGFNVGDAETEERLKEVFASAFFRKVIVTQKKTFTYLIDNKFCKETDILFVFGVVVPQESLLSNTIPKKYYPTDKPTIDICFCATKYTKYGDDKGYPLFVDFMKIIAAKYDYVRFHIIGGFDKDVIAVEEINDKIEFYGYQDFTNLKNILRSMDLIISPNQPDKIKKGAFDGFPLGTVIEAAFNEVVVMLTDCFNENHYFEDGKELVIVQPNVQDMINKFEYLIKDFDSFYAIGKKGKDKFCYMYSNNYQLNPRINLLQSLVS